jgi:uncharacterized protein (TIGR02301 family)
MTDRADVSMRRAIAGVVLAGLVVASPVVRADTAPAYQSDLLRLSELLGTISYLDGLCAGPDASRWRGEMSRLLDAQKLDAEARKPYVSAFNRGLRNVLIAHRACGADTRAVLERLLGEGAALAADIDKRFGTAGVATAPATALPSR